MPGASSDASTPDDGLSVRLLQRAVGSMAAVLPLLLVTIDRHIRGTLSQYYWSASRDVFVSFLFGMGLTLYCYRRGATGEYRGDRCWSNLAGLGTICLAFVPTTSDANGHPNSIQSVEAAVHAAAGIAVFASMAVLAAFYFTRSSALSPTAEKQRRNRIYRRCAALIVACFAVMVSTEFVSYPVHLHVFICAESLAVWSFAGAWLLKSGAAGLVADAPGDEKTYASI